MSGKEKKETQRQEEKQRESLNQGTAGTLSPSGGVNESTSDEEELGSSLQLLAARSTSLVLQAATQAKRMQDVHEEREAGQLHSPQQQNCESGDI